MSTLPRVQHVAPLAMVKKTVTPMAIAIREKKPVSQDAQEEWQDIAQLPNESMRDTLAVPVVCQQDQQGADDSDRKQDEQNPKNEMLRNDSLTSSGIAGVAECPVADETLPLNMNRLGGLIAAFVVHSVVQGSWAVQIPLAHELLQETVLHLRFEQGILTLRFDTSDWRSRETLMRYTPTLLRRLRQSLPQLADVVLFTD